SSNHFPIRFRQLVVRRNHMIQQQGAYKATPRSRFRPGSARASLGGASRATKQSRPDERSMPEFASPRAGTDNPLWPVRSYRNRRYSSRVRRAIASTHNLSRSSSKTSFGSSGVVDPLL